MSLERIQSGRSFVLLLGQYWIMATQLVSYLSRRLTEGLITHGSGAPLGVVCIFKKAR